MEEFMKGEKEVTNIKFWGCFKKILGSIFGANFQFRGFFKDFTDLGDKCRPCYCEKQVILRFVTEKTHRKTRKGLQWA